RLDRLAEPAAGLDAGVAGRERHQVERRIHLAPELETAAAVEPAVHLVRVQAERDRREELRRFALAAPVVRGAVTELRGPARDRVEHLERRDQLARGVNADLDSAAAHLSEVTGQRL